MKRVAELQNVPERPVAYERIAPAPGRPDAFVLRGELGFRLHRALQRIEEELPYSREYLLGQLDAAEGTWSNFPRVHGDIAGRWILAESYGRSAARHPPAELADVVASVLSRQNPDGSFGRVQTEDEPLNMHRAYGNGWLLKGLAQYAVTFGDAPAREAALRLARFYARTFPRWRDAGLSERDTRFYAISVSCYFHALDGLMTLHRGTGRSDVLELAERFVPELAPLEEADHSHMYLTIRRGLLTLLRRRGDRDGIDALADELDRVHEACLLETGGVPERFWLADGEHADDEGCSLFDWLILTLDMHEATDEPRWLERAVLNLENHIFYNQTYNGGFGSCELGGKYKQQGKEAPWCCSLFGPYGLLEGASRLVQRSGDVLRVNHLVSGAFRFGDDRVALEHDERTGTLSVDLSAAPGVAAVEVHAPFWLELTHAGARVASRAPVAVERGSRLELATRYRLWTSRPDRSPRRERPAPGDLATLFLGPYLLTHRFDEAVTVELELDADGFGHDLRSEVLRGPGLYGEGLRVTLPGERPFDETDTFRGVFERPDEVYLYPLKTKETPNQSNAHVRVALPHR